jgi:quercetin 2,3-dioxygenase
MTPETSQLLCGTERAPPRSNEDISSRIHGSSAAVRRGAHEKKIASERAQGSFVSPKLDRVWGDRMIVATSSAERSEQIEPQESWFTFLVEPTLASKLKSAGTLETLREGRLPPNSAPKPERISGEVVTYVQEGSLLYKDSSSLSSVLRAGEFQRITLGEGFTYSEVNESRTHWTHVFQVWLTPREKSAPGQESKRFGAAERRHRLHLVASPDGREGSLTVHQDCLIYSAILPRGRHLVHPLEPGRTALLQVIDGEVQLGELTLKPGDTALLRDEPSVSFSSVGESEVLLIDLGIQSSPLNGVARPHSS